MMHYLIVALFNVVHFNIVYLAVANNVPLIIGSSQLIFTCSKSKIETQQDSGKYVQS